MERCIHCEKEITSGRYCSAVCEAETDRISAEMVADREEFDAACEITDRKIFDATDVMQIEGHFEHFENWLNQHVAEDERKDARYKMLLFIADNLDNTELLFSRSWSEIRNLAEV